MPTKLTHDFVKAQFEKEGYRLLSKEYKNNHTKLDYACPQGHTHSVTWGHFGSGKRCPYCIGRIVTQGQVKEAFEAEGYQLLNTYKKRKTKLEYVCPQGHRHSMFWGDFQDGHRCAHCAKKVITHEQVKKAFEVEGYKLLSQYESSKKELNYICPKGHRYFITWNGFQRGNRCVHCAGHVITHEQVKSAFEVEGYQLLSHYENNRRRLNYICPKGHRHSICWSDFQQGSRCAHCAIPGYNSKDAGRLYYLRFDFPGMKPLYKIGITNRTIKERVREDMQYCTVLLDRLYDDGAIPPKEERKILERFKEWRYKSKPILKNGGNTELFTRDVLMLDRAAMAFQDKMLETIAV